MDAQPHPATGPLTDDGKRASSANATTHGLTAKRLLCDEERERMQVIVASWTAKAFPETASASPSLRRDLAAEAAYRRDPSPPTLRPDSRNEPVCPADPSPADRLNPHSEATFRHEPSDPTSSPEGRTFERTDRRTSGRTAPSDEPSDPSDPPSSPSDGGPNRP